MGDETVVFGRGWRETPEPGQQCARAGRRARATYVTQTTLAVLLAAATGSPVALAGSGASAEGFQHTGLTRGVSAARLASLVQRDTPPVHNGLLLLQNRMVRGLPPTPPAAETALPQVAPLGSLRPVDFMVVSPQPLPLSVAATLARLRGVRATEPVAAAQLELDGQEEAVLGVSPSGFRAFAARPTAADTHLWRSVAAGDIAVSYTMGQQDNLPAGSLAEVAGRQQEALAVGGVGTVGIAGVNAVVSTGVAKSLGFPAHNAIVISVTSSRIQALAAKIKKDLPKSAVVAQLEVPGQPVYPGGQAASPVGIAKGGANGLLTSAETSAMLRAALSRVGMPYVWGAAGPREFDCSGLVQWSFAQAGLAMPRVAADQALTGPAVAVSSLVPGDLLFYHTDPTAPGYVSHVAIYLGGGKMLQAPEPGMDVQIVPAITDGEFAGAVAVSPAIAAAAAASDG